MTTRSLLAMFLVAMFLCASASAQTTAFTHQGSLRDGANPANGNYDFEFRLFDSLVGSSQQGATIQRSNIAVASGIYVVSLDFGAAVFPGADRFLDISVRPAGGGVFTQLNPRQQVTSAPYAIKSLNSETAVNAAQLGGINADGFIRNSGAQQPTSNFNISGNGTAGGTLSSNILNATTQFNIAGNTVLSAVGPVISIGANNGSNTVQVAGPFQVHLEEGGGSSVCRNASDALSSCVSSVRYKEKVTAFSSGLDLVKQLRPVAFDWKVSQVRDVGLIAEEVVSVEALLITRNKNGEVEGVKYDRIGVVLINAVKEQQAMIESQQKRIDHQQAQIDAFKKLVCAGNAIAAVCRDQE